MYALQFHGWRIGDHDTQILSELKTLIPLNIIWHVNGNLKFMLTLIRKSLIITGTASYLHKSFWEYGINRMFLLENTLSKYISLTLFEILTDFESNCYIIVVSTVAETDFTVCRPDVQLSRCSKSAINIDVSCSLFLWKQGRYVELTKGSLELYCYFPVI